VPLTVLSRIAGLLDLLRSGFAKFRSDRDYARRFAEPLLQATNAHLEDLYTEMIAPLRSLLQGGHVVIVPHGLAHYLPFHAFRSGDEYLSDAFVISYAPSATEFSACQTRPPVTQEASLVLGIPDPRVPEVLSEVQLVASLVPRPEILIGDRATAAAVREKGQTSGLLHIATRATYRQDNPMFSGLHLADGDLNLHDLYQMRLGCALVTLSGCAAGINTDATGDDLLGLQRGLFCAGACSLVLSLWDVHDRSTTQLLKHFYTAYKRTGSSAPALQSAMRLLRQEYAHPFYWAPLFASGQLPESKPIN
jgi:CHAT domain-containing protein